MSERSAPQELVLDTSVAVKFYLPEGLGEEALALLSAVGEGAAKLLAPSTIQPELFNALWQQHRRGKLSREEVGDHWGDFSVTSTDPYAPEDLMPRAADIALEPRSSSTMPSSSRSPRTPRPSSSPPTTSYSRPSEGPLKLVWYGT